MKKRLLYILSSLANCGGLERILTDKLNWLAEHSQYEVFLLTFEQNGHSMAFPLHPVIEYEDLSVMIRTEYQYSGLKRMLYHYRSHKLLREKLTLKISEISPDIVICCQRLIMPDVETSRGVVPLIFECHSGFRGYELEGASFRQHLKMKMCDRAIRKAQQVVTLTNGDASDWRKVNKHVVTIPNMVHLNDTGKYSDCKSKSVIFVGRYDVQKDIGSLLKIWEIVNSRHPDWQLHLYGGYGSEQTKWMPMIEQMRANVYAHESTSQIFDKYMESSMLLMTSVHEPFGLVLPEAMSCGLPVVSFDCPYGPADIISDGVDGFLIKDRNIVVFADRVCQLIEDEDLRIKMGKAGILSSQKYKAGAIMPKWLELFSRVK